MEEDLNDLAQSEKDEPKLVTQIILIVAVVVMVMVFFLGMWFRQLTEFIQARDNGSKGSSIHYLKQY